MRDVEREAEAAVAELGMGDAQRARREPRRQSEPAAEQLDEVAGAAEDQRPVLDMDGERHADAASDIFLEAGRSGEPLGRMDDLRERGPAGVEPRPDLAL